MICPLCGKDLTQAAAVLGAPLGVFQIHRDAHIREAVQRLLDDSAQWPELEEHFKPLQDAVNLNLKSMKRVL